MTSYVIKTYLKHKIDNTYRFVCILPYVFDEEPVNVCAKLNEMFPNWKHMIAIKED